MKNLLIIFALVFGVFLAAPAKADSIRLGVSNHNGYFSFQIGHDHRNYRHHYSNRYYGFPNTHNGYFGQYHRHSMYDRRHIHSYSNKNHRHGSFNRRDKHQRYNNNHSRKYNNRR